MERFRGSGKNGKRTCAYCQERARWRVRIGWKSVYACHEHKDKLPIAPIQSRREEHFTEADYQTWRRL